MTQEIGHLAGCKRSLLNYFTETVIDMTCLLRSMVKTATNKNGESQNGDTKTATIQNCDKLREHNRNGDKDVWSKRRQTTAKCLQEIHALVNSAT